MAKKEKSAAAVELGRAGGLARKKNLTAKQLSEIGKKAAAKRWSAKPDKKGKI